MPPSPKAKCISKGSGITAGLELWLKGARFILVDKSPDGRFADDVAQWNNKLSKKAA